MRSSEVRADGLTARFSAAGFTPHVKHHDTHICIEAEVPDSVSAEPWRELLAVLEEADSFGVTASSVAGCTVWAVVHKVAPAAADAARGPGHQL